MIALWHWLHVNLHNWGLNDRSIILSNFHSLLLSTSNLPHKSTCKLQIKRETQNHWHIPLNFSRAVSRVQMKHVTWDQDLMGSLRVMIINDQINFHFTIKSLNEPAMKKKTQIFSNNWIINETPRVMSEFEWILWNKMAWTSMILHVHLQFTYLTRLLSLSKLCLFNERAHKFIFKVTGDIFINSMNMCV